MESLIDVLWRNMDGLDALPERFRDKVNEPLRHVTLNRHGNPGGWLQMRFNEQLFREEFQLTFEETYGPDPTAAYNEAVWRALVRLRTNVKRVMLQLDADDPRPALEALDPNIKELP